MKRYEDAVFSCGKDENDIDQDDSYVRADGHLVADTAFSSCWGDPSGKYMAQRITLALNLVRGRTLEEIRGLHASQSAASDLLAALETIMGAHKFNVASMSPTEVHALCCTAVDKAKGKTL